MILTCTDHGVRGIFCEKPMAPDLASCDAIVDACDRSHVKFAMAFQTRYSPRYAKVKELIKVGAIGDLLEIRARGKEDRRGGGEDLMVLGVHVFDLCHDLLGEPSWCFSRVTDRGKAITAQEVRQGAEGIGPLAGDRVDAMFGFQGTNVVAHFATSRPKEPGKRFGLTINGSKGSIWMGTGFTPPAFLLRDATWTSTGTEKWTPIKASEQDTKDAPPTDLTNGNSEILRDLIHAVESDTQALTDARAGRVAIEMVLACYASSVKGGIVHMPLVDRKNHPLTGLGKG
jgi:predicted dehydrogenase